MKTRLEVIREVAPAYRAATKRRKTDMLDELVLALDCRRTSLIRALRRESGSWGGSRSSSGRKPTYGIEVVDALKRVWAILDFACGKRLVAQMGEMLQVLDRFGELRVSPETRSRLLSLSASTADRLLASERKRMELRGRRGTKPGSLLRSQVRLRTFSDWDESRPGFTEIDLVSHEGGNARGDFCYTLTLTDVSTGWTECYAVKNRAQQWTFDALKRLRTRLPFPLLGLDSDNGSEFINHHLIWYCDQERIDFTRSRPYRKNDNCFVEQKNTTVVRQTVGYARYDTEVERTLLNRLYGRHRLYYNYFIPQMKLVEKTREGSRVRRRYDTPQTAYQRVVASPTVSEEIKAELREDYRGLNPAALRREINDLQRDLWQSTALKEERRKHEALEST